MTRIDFYTGVGNVQAFACRAAQTVYRKQERLLVVLADDQALEAFSRALWSFGEGSFIAHSRWDAKEASASRIWLATHFDVPAAPTVMLNLGEAQAEDPSRFARILEVVSQDEAAKAVARQRYRRYLDLGFEIQHHDMSDAA
ncbi:MAG: DNA polymerase III subunit chi [Vogesella sp.]|uniref:DNA polymerase III subunit chi n=1 Tax=Vogesella sp. TaxID=1904252 RepID=UPI0039192E88